MLSQRFYVRIILRIIVIALTALGLAFSFVYLPLYLTALPFVFLVLQCVWLIQSIDRKNQKVSLFFDSIKNEDFSLKYPEDAPEKSFRGLYKRMNEVNQQIQQIFKENRAREAYFQEVLKQVEVGILCYDPNGHVLFANPMVKRLLNCDPLNHIRKLESTSQPLFELLATQEPFGRKLIEISNEREVIQLSLKSSIFHSTEGTIYLLTVQDIRNELDEKETDSWSKLIKVMTHEIMNTVTPITSISAAILSNFKVGEQLVPVQELNEKRVANTVKGLEVISEQGKDLMNFVQSYRSFLSLTEPERETVSPQELFERVRLLFAQELADHQIELRTQFSPQEMELFLDKKQIMQVLVNLCKNAVQALQASDQESKQIQLTAGIDPAGKKYLEVRDNGPGIDPKLIEHIFVPFFTTKNTGTGIGLSLSKQILRLHDGSLKVYSVPGERTVFLLSFG